MARKKYFFVFCGIFLAYGALAAALFVSPGGADQVAERTTGDDATTVAEATDSPEDASPLAAR